MSVAAANSSTEPSVDRPAVGVPAASALWVLIAGVVGLAAAFTLTIEKIKLLENPAYVPSCSINPVLSCGSVMATPQAAAFGFPNPLIGVMAFSVVVVSGVLAVAKVPLPRWYWTGARGGYHTRRGLHPLAHLSEPLRDRRAVPVLHGGVGHHDSTDGRGGVDRVGADRR